jgi:hypothetical protein
MSTERRGRRRPFYPTDRLSDLQAKAKALRDEVALLYQFGGANSYSHSVLSLAEAMNAAIADILDVKWRSGE